MSAHNYEELVRHVGHKVVVVGYGEGGKPPYWNVAVECDDCDEVLLDHDKDNDEKEGS